MFNLYPAYAIIFTQGCYVYDIDGNKYLDSLAGLWCTALGTDLDENSLDLLLFLWTYISDFLLLLS